MVAWGSLVVLAACGGASEPEPPGDTATLSGIDRELFERLYADRFCDEWALCASSGACPLEPGETRLPGFCAYDPVAAQACIVEPWDCAQGSSYPVEPDACSLVCDGDYTYGTTGTP